MPQQEKKQGQLIQAFGLQAAIILVVSSIIGSGVYKKVAPMSDKLESADLVLLAWLLAGIISMLGVLTTAEIAGMVSGSGGPFAYFNRIYGRTFAFFYGWSSFTAIQSASIAAIAYVFATRSMRSFRCRDWMQLPKPLIYWASFTRFKILGLNWRR